MGPSLDQADNQYCFKHSTTQKNEDDLVFWPLNAMSGMCLLPSHDFACERHVGSVERDNRFGRNCFELLMFAIGVYFVDDIQPVSRRTVS